MIEFTGACARHRPALLDFVDHAEIGPATGEAMVHLDQCDRCTADLEAIALTITALRRIGDEADRVEPAEDAWPRLQARLARWRPARWRIMSPIAGMAMSVALVAVLVVPLRFEAVSGPAEASPTFDSVGPPRAERQLDATSSSATHRAVPSSRGPAAGSTGSVSRNYPDGIRPVRKDVPSDRVSVRPTQSR